MDSLEIHILGVITAKANGSQGIMVLAGIVVAALVCRMVTTRRRPK